VPSETSGLGLYIPSPSMTPTTPLSAISDTLDSPSVPTMNVSPASSNYSLPGPSSSNFVHFEVPLGNMGMGWHPFESDVGRRIVKFHVRRAPGGFRTVSCRPIHPSEYVGPVSGGIMDTVSCIANPVTGELVITSCDLLELAGLLYGEKPETEEKNRLRRHIERMEPRTIGKRRDPDGLFARIASYNEPRALTIVKDVKVFEWARLEEALEMIMAKGIADFDRFPQPARRYAADDDSFPSARL
jgi:hypothetical protein